MSVAKKRKRKFRSMANQEYCNKRNIVPIVFLTNIILGVTEMVEVVNLVSYRTANTY